MDRFIAKQYSNTVPVIPDRKNSPIEINTTVPFAAAGVSSTTTKTSHVLPLLFYWQWQYTNSCSLNPALAAQTFAKTIQSRSKKLAGALGDRKLVLTLTEVPGGFALVDKAHLIFILYSISWDNIYIEPDQQPMTVAYQLQNADGSLVKEGKISIPGNQSKNQLGFFQSWKSATNSYLADYNNTVTRMSRDFLEQLDRELGISDGHP